LVILIVSTYMVPVKIKNINSEDNVAYTEKVPVSYALTESVLSKLRYEFYTSLNENNFFSKFSYIPIRNNTVLLNWYIIKSFKDFRALSK